MRIRVLYFSVLVDAVGTREEDLVLPESATIADVIADAARRHPKVTPHLPSMLVTRNEEWADRAANLCDGDTVGLMPPVSGG